MGEHYSGDAGRPQHAISTQVYSVALRLRGGVRVLRSVGVVGATSKVWQGCLAGLPGQMGSIHTGIEHLHTSKARGGSVRAA